MRHLESSGQWEMVSARSRYRDAEQMRKSKDNETLQVAFCPFLATSKNTKNYMPIEITRHLVVLKALVLTK